MLYDAIVLAGGRSRRLGGVPKAEMRMPHDGRTLLERSVAAAGPAQRIVVVGPGPQRPLPAAVLVAREDPPFGGPAAGVAAGLDALSESDAAAGGGSVGGVPEWVLVLACDMPHAVEAVRVLMAAAAAGGDGDGVIAQDGDNRLQPLAAVYRRGALAAVVREHREAGSLDGAAMFGLVRGLALTPVPVPATATADVDTWGDAQALGVLPPRDPTPRDPTSSEPKEHTR